MDFPYSFVITIFHPEKKEKNLDEVLFAILGDISDTVFG
jgi:hypothetical protein